ncbi:unnamed protein product [Parajaminaea phylloscopi]
MATAKLATLLIRTLAKPIATQLKAQAASHESFRRVCVTIAQTMHRSEMALRYNLLPRAPAVHTEEDGGGGKEREKPKVRPLNEAKAIANGANFLSEAFLFVIAAGLIVGESWRSANKNKQQRNRTEEKVEEVSMAVQALCARLGVDPRSVGLEKQPDDSDASAASQVGTSNSSDEFASSSEDDSATEEDAKREASRHAAAARHQLKAEEQMQRLQSAVDVLLRMAIKSGWIQGPEALDLSAILDGRGAVNADGGTKKDSASPDGQDSSGSSILQQVAASRARHFAAMSRVSASEDGEAGQTARGPPPPS